MKQSSSLAAALVAATLLAAPALAETDFPSAISVTGEAQVSAPPDLAQLDAGVASDGKTAREAAGGQQRGDEQGAGGLEGRRA